MNLKLRLFGSKCPKPGLTKQNLKIRHLFRVFRSTRLKDGLRRLKDGLKDRFRKLKE